METHSSAHRLRRTFLGALSLTAALACHAQTPVIEGNVTPGTPWDSNSFVVVGSYRYSGDGSIKIETPMQVQSAGVSIGYSSGRRGTAIVSGAGAQWNTQSFDVGTFGIGVLTIENGGRIASSGQSISGYNANGSGTITVTGVGSQWNVHELFVGFEATSVITIENGGRMIAADNFAIAIRAESNGTVTVTGAGSQLYTPMLRVSQRGRAKLTIENNGLVAVQDSSTSDNFTIGTNGVIEISNGFFAWQGNHTAKLLQMIQEGSFHYWNGTAYVSLANSENYSDYFTLEFVENVAESTAFGNNPNLVGLDGYTILTAIPVPEPGTYAVILTLLSAGLALRIKRSNRAK